MTTSSRLRADRLLVERGLFDSRAKAQAAIAAGLVSANGTTVRKASEEIATDAAIEATPAYPYVSRGGLKLAAALDHFGFDPKGRVCLDVGASTGGFTRCCWNGARRKSTRSMSDAGSCTKPCARGRRWCRWKQPTSAPLRPAISIRRPIWSPST